MPQTVEIRKDKNWGKRGTSKPQLLRPHKTNAFTHRKTLLLQLYNVLHDLKGSLSLDHNPPKRASCYKEIVRPMPIMELPIGAGIYPTSPTHHRVADTCGCTLPLPPPPPPFPKPPTPPGVVIRAGVYPPPPPIPPTPRPIMELLIRAGAYRSPPSPPSTPPPPPSPFPSWSC